MDQETELDNLNAPRELNRSSWASTDIDDSTSYAPSTVHDNTYASRPTSSMSHRQSFHKTSLDELQRGANTNQNPFSDSERAPPSTRINVATAEPAIANVKPSLIQKFKASLPTFPQFRKTVKASLALLIAVIFIFATHTREIIKDSVLLVAIVTIFYFPVRTIGVQTEAVFLGTLGGLIASAWSFLGMYLANLARNPMDRNPVQPGACAVLAVFLFVGTFAINLVRMKVHKANFACVIACILLTFTMTYAAGYPIFVPEIAWLFLRPVALAGALSLAVNYFIWPDDSINNFLGIARKTLAGYNAFFKEHSEAFLSVSPSTSNASLLGLNARLQNGVLLLIDCKRAVKRELLYSRISDVDCSDLTRAITEMRSSLHGIGLSLILKNDYAYSETKDIYFQKFNDPLILDAFYSSIEGIRSVATELSDMCYKATNEASNRLGALHYHPRTTLNSILWPFPRFYVSKSKLPVESSAQTASITAAQVRELIRRFDEVSKSDQAFHKFLSMNAADIPRNGPLYLIFLYIYNLKNHATNTAGLLELIESIEAKRVKPRFWLPHQTLKRWIAGSSNVGGSIGGDVVDYRNNGNNDLGRISTRANNANSDSEEDDDDDLFEVKRSPSASNAATRHKKGQLHGDPDVTAPITVTQKFFNCLYLIGKWFTDTTTFFAFKTAVGVVMLAVPAWRPQDQGWYTEWRGQWAMITLVLWMFPMTGAFVFGLFDRILGSIVGCVLGIVVWEMCRGNPYGMAVVCFIVFLPLYHIFFFIPKYRVASLMSSVTMILVLAYEYGYVVEGLTNYDKVYTVAGKRLLLVLIGIAASGILMAIPFPPTGRVELRKKIANTVRDIGRCYGILSAIVVSPTGERAPPSVAAMFVKLALELRRQVAAERALLHDATYEPPLRGYFPAESYKVLVEKMDNMSDLVTSMGHALRDIRPEWRKNIASILMQERREYLASILTYLKLISSTLAAKTPLPPYMLSPVESRQKFINLLEKKIMVEPKDIANISFPSFSAYLMNGLVFVDELQRVLSVTQDLVGVENPEEWILSRA